MRNRSGRVNIIVRRRLGDLALGCVIAFSHQVMGQAPGTLERLTEDRQMPTARLDQYRKPMDILHSDDTPPEQRANPAAGSLAVDDTRETDAGNVERLHQLLEGYYAELQEPAQVLPANEELTQQEASHRDAEILNKTPFSVDKVRLDGTEGSTALANISQRLMDPRIPESRRDTAPICTIKTRLFDTLVSSENRSLKPVGKNHYIARVQLQPGTTTLSILSNQWEVQLPQQFAARDYLVTLYQPVGDTPELHIFAVDDLLAADRPHIPDWLPAELDIKTKAG
jgi:hypothetical protein